ncbi:MAG: ParB/RepB/Spo0J family partition protein [Clostridia bacterium]|nr:ParB/RepB/Spo0J family partition protein [Clostridia bacterium]
MKKVRKKAMDVNYEKKTLPISLVDTETTADDWEKKDLKTRGAYFLLNGAPEFSVNQTGDARFKLLSAERDFHAAKGAGMSEITARIYHFSDKHAETFSLIERLKEEKLTIMEEAYLMKKLVKNCGLTQDDVAALVGKSRPAIANTLRLLTLAPEVVGLIESGKLSAGHARTLIKVPQEKQLAFAESALRRGYSVRDMERAVKAYLTPPEVLKREKEAKEAAKSEQLKSLIERMRVVLGTQVSLIGNDKKGRIYIDYHSPEALLRIEEVLGIEEVPDEQLSIFPKDDEE